jgi:hypothetical protein
MTCIAIRISATTSPLVPEVTAQAARICAALNTQALRDVAPLWGSAATGIRALAKDEIPAASESILDVVDTFPPEDGNAEAFHTETSGKPVLEDALDDATTLADATTSWSHEMIETMGDPSVNREAVSFTTGWAYMLEIADPFEQNSYPIDLADGGPPIMVSDFALPSWFDDEGVAPFSYCELQGLPGARAPGPFQPASGGGYIDRRQITTSETEVDARVRWAYTALTALAGIPVVTPGRGALERVGTPRPRRARRLARKGSRAARRRGR